MAAKHWMQAESRREKKAGTKGALTKKAHAAGFSSATAYAHNIPAGASTKTKHQASMALAYEKARH